MSRLRPPANTTTRVVNALDNANPRSTLVGQDLPIATKTKKPKIKFIAKKYFSSYADIQYLKPILSIKDKDPRYPLRVFKASDNPSIYQLKQERRYLRAMKKNVDFWTTLSEKEKQAAEKYKFAMRLRAFKSGKEITIVKIENEFQYIKTMSANKEFWKTLSANEKQALESYKLDLMQSVESHLCSKRVNGHEPNRTLENNPKISKWRWLKWLGYITLFLLDLVPMVWGNYVGIIDLLALVPGFPAMIIEGIGIGTSIVEVILYYAMMSPLVKEALDIPNNVRTQPQLETYNKQLQTINKINSMMLNHNKMSAAEYKQFLRLINLFNDHLCSLREFDIYLRTSFESIDLANIEDNAIILVDNLAYLIKNKQFVKNEAGENLSLPIALSGKEKYKLDQACDENGKIKLEKNNSKLLDKIRETVLSKYNFALQSTVQQYKESKLKKGIRWVLSGISLAYNIGGSYLFALMLLGTAAATTALLATPAGWGILSILVIGQILLQLLVRNDSLFKMFNPVAKKHNEIRMKINQYESPKKKYDETLENKKTEEALHKKSALLKEQRAATNKQEIITHIKGIHHIDLPSYYENINFNTLRRPLRPLPAVVENKREENKSIHFP